VAVKYGDNVLKNFTTSCSVILGTVISVFLFDFQLTLQFVWGAALVMFSAYIYGRAVTTKSGKGTTSMRLGSSCFGFLDYFSEDSSDKAMEILLKVGHHADSAEADSCDELIPPKLHERECGAAVVDRFG